MKKILWFGLAFFSINLAYAKELFQCPTKLYLGNVTASTEQPLPEGARLALLKDSFIWLEGAGLNSGPPEEYAVLKPSNGDEENPENHYWDELDFYNNHPETSLYFVCSYSANIKVTKKLVSPVSVCTVKHSQNPNNTNAVEAVFECE